MSGWRECFGCTSPHTCDRESRCLIQHPRSAAPPAVPDAPPNKPSRGLSAEAKERLQKFGSRVGDFDDPPSCPHGVMAGACPACLAIPDAPPMQGDDAELCEKLMEQPTEDLQGFAAVECGQLMGLAAERIEQLSTQDHNWHTWGIIEVAIRNPNVSSYMDHWEKRTLAAESLVAQQKERIAELNKLIASAEWAQSGYCPWCAGWEVERNRGCKPNVHRKDCPAIAAIDAALAADQRSTKHQPGETK